MLLCALLLQVMVFVTPVRAARAANPCAGTVSDFEWQSGDFVTGGRFVSGGDGQARVSFRFALDASAAAGDGFTLTLPDELVVLGHEADIPLSIEGVEVGRGHWSGKTAQFVFNSQIEKYGDVSGQAWFTVGWDRARITTSGQSYRMTFTGCRGSGTLDGEYLADGPSGTSQGSGKTGRLPEGNELGNWTVFVATTRTDVYEPLVIEDSNGPGYELLCEGVTVSDRTPAPHTAIKDTPIDSARWSCSPKSGGGVVISFKPLSDGRYQPARESLMIEIPWRATAQIADLDDVVNTARISVAENGKPKDVTGKILIPRQGGDATGYRAKFTIEKKTTGDGAPSDARFEFEYKCLADEFISLPGIRAGERTAEVSTRSSATCIIREKDLPHNATLSLDVVSGGASVSPVDGGFAVTFAKNAQSEVRLLATNHYRQETGTFKVRKAVEANGAAVPEAFTVRYDCGDGSKTLVVPANGTWAQSEPIAAGATCRLSEDERSAASAGYRLDARFSDASVTIVGGRTSEVTLTNTYTQIRGGFKIKKTVDAPQGAPVPAQFPFHYECRHGLTPVASGDLLIAGDGRAHDAGVSVPVGSQCTVTEKTADPAVRVDGYTLEGSPRAGSGAVETTLMIDEDPVTVDTAVFLNTYTRDAGTFSVKKTATQEAVGHRFSFAYTCSLNGQPLPNGSGRIAAVAGGEAVGVGAQFPTGASCVVSEIQDGATIPGFTLKPPAPQTITIDAPNQVVEVVFHNAYTRDTGGFTVRKKVDGTAANLADGAEFSFTYTCLDPATSKTTADGRFSLKANESQTISPLPTGVCTITEEEPADVDHTDRMTTITVNGERTDGTSAEFALEKNASVNIEVTNTYTRRLGRFSIAKSVEAHGADVPAEFTFIYDCGQGERTIVVPGNGDPVESPQVDAGTTCTIREDTASAMVPGYSLDSRISHAQVIVPDEEIVRVAARNEYSPIPPAPRTPGKTAPMVPSAPSLLAKTGSSAAVVAGGALVALIAGGILLAVRKRRQ
ncbi:DUF5979 domain-containing protein [Actinomyces sp. B33]|uniref:DUF5979 domain-containing protein n=1 Tax=Actinomyces sp. B33 TaxID=2942131 RepID=UPI00234062BA|nr:DUF5979 domain-containing protein [Actinomyces sp. B33]MDC4232302.1 DUF5979 domain-containing protein [Actinomyces sp. B33]